jgi:hypothetical protein
LVVSLGVLAVAVIFGFVAGVLFAWLLIDLLGR